MRWPIISAISKVRRPKNDNWLSTANLWTITGLAITAIASIWVATRAPTATPTVELTQTVAGESTTAPVDERIELAQVGTAVWSHNPSGEEDLTFGDKVDPATWKHLVLRSHKKDGSACEINLLRPDWWVQEEAAEKGGTVYVSVPECGIDGDAEVLEIRPCPPIQECPLGYRTITGTFHHQNAKVIDLYIEGLAEPIGTTPNHPFWSVDRREFVRADALVAGEALAGLRVTPLVHKVYQRPTTGNVFNLEVLGQHVYLVGEHGVLVHNSTQCVQFKQWKRGDAIDKPMPDGSAPSWDTVRSRYWKNRYEASKNTGEFTDIQLEAMRKGKAPLDFNRRTMEWEARELHHVDAQRHVVDNSPLNLRELTPDWHAQVDPFRQVPGIEISRGIR